MGKKNEPKLNKPESPTEIINRFFPPLTYADLERYRENPDNFIFGRGFIRKGAGTIFVGPTSIGKSVLICQMCVCAACGLPFLGMEARKPCQVIYIQAENDKGVMKRVFKAIVEHLGANTTLLNKNLIIRAVPGIEPEYFHPWLEKELTKHKPDLLAIDPYQSFVGGADLNNTGAWFEWSRPIDEMIKKYKVGLALVAHTGKPRKEMEDWSPNQMIYAMTGTSAAQNWARAAMIILPLKNDHRFHAYFSKGAETTGMIEKGQPVKSFFMEHSDDWKKPFWKISERQEPLMKADVKGSIMKLLKKNPKMSQRVLAETLDVHRATVKKYTDEIKKEKKK